MGEFYFSVLMKKLNSLKTSLAIGRIASRDSFSTFMKLQSSEYADSRGIPSFDIGGLGMCGGDSANLWRSSMRAPAGQE